MQGYMIKQYAAKEQAELRVRVQVPGAWFGGLLPSERRQHYEAEAYDWKESHHFPKVPLGRAAQTCAAIKFLCESDVLEDPQHDGFIMPLSDWNQDEDEGEDEAGAAAL